MKIKSSSLLVLFLIVVRTVFSQIVVSNSPKLLVDVGYSNQYSFLNNTKAVSFKNGDIIMKLKNDFEINVAGIFPKNLNNNRHKLYMGFGFNYSEYLNNRNLFSQNQSYSSHFPMTYSYNPNKLEYKLNVCRSHFQLCHYVFYKSVVVFQNLGLAFSSYIKKSNSATQYVEQYGNSTPNTNAAYITASNPEGWYFQDNYTYLTKNDLDIYKNGFNAFYKFGMGIKVKKLMPFAAIEFSNITGNFWSSYLKFQIGINYFILPK
jgi:hypothetical protein